MSDQHLSVEDEIERALRLGLATAGQLGDRYARARHDIARQAHHRSEQEAQQLQARYRAEGASAVARLAVLDRQEWWDRATPEQIAGMWALAGQWRDDQPRAAAAADTIARQVRDRYGVDVNPASGPRTVERGDVGAAVAAVVRAEQRDAGVARAAEEHVDGSRVGTAAEGDQAVLLELEADQYDRQASQDGTAASTPDELRVLARDARAHSTAVHAEVPELAVYDSFERREQTAAALQEAALPAEAVEVAMRADVAQGRPAADAVSARMTASPAAGRRAMARGGQRADRSR